MLELNAAPFVEALSALMRLRAGVETPKSSLRDSVTPGRGVEFNFLKNWDRDTYSQDLRVVLESVRKLGATNTATAVDRAIKNIESDTTYQMLSEEIRDIQRRLQDELSEAVVFALSGKGKDLYRPSEPHFGPLVSSQFVASKPEIEEAGKCLALRRPTAAVFHLMRSLEIVLEGLRLCLGIPELAKANRSWGTILKKVRTEIDLRNGAAPPKWSVPGDPDFFSGLHASLIAVKDTWRDEAMHISDPYTEEQAEEVFVTVRVFMKKAASRFNASGDLKA